MNEKTNENLGKNEEALQKSEEKFRQIFESASDAMIFLDRFGRIFDGNRKALEIFGGSKEEILGKHFARLGVISVRDIPRLVNGFARSLVGKEIIHDVCIKNKKGQEIHLDCSGSLLKIRDEFAGVLVIARDATERKKTEERIRVSEETYRNLVELAPDCIMTFDLKGVITSCNTAATRMSGYSKDELVGKHFSKIGPIRARGVPKYLKMLYSTLRGNVPEPFELIWKHKNGTPHFGEVRFSLIKEKGKMVGIQAILRDITERKKAEEALRKSENKSRTLLENLPQKIFFKDKNSVYISCNENYARDLKIKSDEIAGKTDYDFHPKGLAEKYRADDKRIMKSGKTEDIEEEYIQDGQKAFVHTVKTPVKDENGDTVGLLGIFWDITERKETEEELIRLSSAVKMSIDGIVISDINAKIMNVNEAALKMYGANNKEDLIGKNSFDLIAPEEREKALAGMKEVLEKGYLKDREYHIITKDGSRIPVEMSVSTMKSMNSKPMGFVAISRDITERKKMEEQLRQYSENLEELVQKRTEELSESERRYSVLVEEASDGVVILQDEKIVFTNKRAAETLGYSRDEIVGLPIEKLVTEKHRQLVIETYRHRLRGEHVPATYEIDALSKIDELIPLELSATRINYQNRPASLIILRDIRERKRLEEERLKLGKLAAIGELATMVGHDLRNPLTGILGAEYYLKKRYGSKMDDKAKEMLEIIEKNIEYSNKIINDLLEYSREIKLELTESNPKQVIKEALSLVDIPTNVQVIDLTENQPKINVDTEKMKRALVNIVKNAIEAMPEGGTLTIKSRKLNGNIEIAFTDTGIGMPEGTTEKLFTPLFTTKAKGMGFGLPICKRIIDAHGGKMSVKSAVGKGATFTIIIPTKQKFERGEKIWVNVPESLLSTTTKA